MVPRIPNITNPLMREAKKDYVLCPKMCYLYAIWVSFDGESFAESFQPINFIMSHYPQKLYTCHKRKEKKLITYSNRKKTQSNPHRKPSLIFSSAQHSANHPNNQPTLISSPLSFKTDYFAVLCWLAGSLACLLCLLAC